MSKTLLTATQKGEVAENMVANVLIVESDGRLSPFRPIADDGGMDLLIFDKTTGRALPCQVKSRTVTLKRHPNICHFQVRKASFNKATYLLAMLLDWKKMKPRCFWLIPPEEFAVGRKTETKYVFRPSIAPDSRDKYTKFRYNTGAKLITAICNILDKAK